MFRIERVPRIGRGHVFSKPAARPAAPRIETGRSRRQSVVVIGASTGGPPALAQILKALPPNLPAPVAIVQHIAPGFITGVREWLRRQCALAVQLALNRQAVAAR